MENNELSPIVIDLNIAKSGEINESFLGQFGSAIKLLLKTMFPAGAETYGPSLRTRISGTPSQIAAFGNTLSKEKKYMDAFLKYGLNDPRSFSSRHQLEAAIKNFEKETSIKWPIK